jgi:integrase/recombinase XerD
MSKNADETKVCGGKGGDLQGMIKSISLMFRKNGVSYDQGRYIFSEIRKINKLKASNDTKKKLPLIPSYEEREALLEVSKENFIHWVAIKLLFDSGLRTSELINVRCMDVFLSEKKIFVNKGKMGDGYVYFPAELEMHLARIVKERKGSDYLILSRLYKPYTRQGVYSFVKKYIKRIGTKKSMSTHTLRHYFATRMSKGMSDSKAQVMTRHASKKSLAIYQHISLGDVTREEYELAIKQ